MRGLVILMILSSVTWVPAHAGECSSLDRVDWMLGQWNGVGRHSATRESWSRVSPDTLEGYGSRQSVESGEIAVTETLRLVAMSGGVYYIAKVAENDLPVPFAMTACGDDFATFENPVHDFPRRLEYRREGPDQMTVTVGGDSEQGFTIRFIRVSDHP